MKTLSCRKGTAAVEFAIILPLLVVLVFGIIEFSLLLYDKHVITNASREGARYGIVFRDTERVPDAEITQKVNEYCSNYLVTFGAVNSPTTTITRSGSSPGDSLTVTVSFNYDFLVLPNFIQTLAGVKTLNAVTVMRME